MPYLERAVRASLDDGRKPITPGELNYGMSQLVKAYIEVNGVSYTTYNAIAGVLACLSMEVYRRLTAPYEDQKLSETGEVF